MNCAKAIVAYVPVLHRGYWELFARHAAPGTVLGVLGDWFTSIEELSYFRKDIRRLDVFSATTVIRGLGMFERVVTLDNVQDFLCFNPATAVVSVDHVTRVLEATYPAWFAARAVVRDSSFLMWDRMSTKAPAAVVPDRTVSAAEFSEELLRAVKQEASLSSDWWRRVGAVAIRDGAVLHSAHNAHLSTEQQPYEVGDPRGSFHKGADLDMTSAIHAEQALVAAAARGGPTLEGADMLVTTFPCPPCAKLIKHAGIRRLYFMEGYAMLDAQDILRAAGVEIVMVR